MSGRVGLSVEVPPSGDGSVVEKRTERDGETGLKSNQGSNGGGTGEVQDEDASKLLRRLSSPIYNTGAFEDDNGDADGGKLCTPGFSDDEAKDEATEKIQRWWRVMRSTGRRTDAVMSARASFETMVKLLAEVDARQLSFEQTGVALQDEVLQRAATTAFRTLPPDKSMAALPRASRSARAILSSVMIVYFESELLPQPEGEESASAQGGSGTRTSTSSTVTNRRKRDPAAAALRNASGLMLASVRAVAAALAPVDAGEIGARKTLITRLWTLRFARKYFAVSLLSWKKEDAQRMAAQVVQPYARAYATKITACARGDEPVASMVEAQLVQYRRALEQLVGRERAHNSLQEVELAVKADLSGSGAAAPEGGGDDSGPNGNVTSTSPPVRTPTPTSTSTPASAVAAVTPNSTILSSASTSSTTSANKDKPMAAAGAAGGVVTGVPRQQAGERRESGREKIGRGEGGGEFKLPDGQLGRLLGNERLAHEILVNPDFKIPGDDADDPHTLSPEAELTKRFKDVMRRIFWDRLTQSLLPPPPPTPAAAAPDGGAPPTDQDAAKVSGQPQQQPQIQEGSKVQARYGSERGSFYAATVVKVILQREQDISAGGNDDGEVVAVDLKYDSDGVVERAVPVSRLRTSEDPPDFGPLLSLLAEVRGELISLTPNNTTLVDEVKGVLGQERLTEMLEDKKLDARQVQKLVWFIAGRILELQAPVRSDAARAWLQGFDAEMEAAASSEDESAIVPLLPRAFEFVFAQIEEIKRDVANAHVRLIAPYLARHGAEYERSKFETRLAHGAASLANTKAWITRAVQAYVGSDVSDGGAGTEAERAARTAGLREGREEHHKELLQQAFMRLLQSNVRLDSQQQAGLLPETLEADGGRLAAARDDSDRVALIATLCVLMRQVLARLHIACPPQTMATLQTKLSSILKQDGVSLEQIVDECVAAANRIASPSSSTATAAAASATASTTAVGMTLTPSSRDPASGMSGLPKGEAEGLKKLLMGSADPKSEVFRVFSKRVLLTLKGLLVAGGDASDLCGRHGLHSFTDDLQAVGMRLRRLFNHNLKVFSGHYSRIVAEEVSDRDTPDR